jgi:hypothetical protein
VKIITNSFNFNMNLHWYKIKSSSRYFIKTLNCNLAKLTHVFLSGFSYVIRTHSVCSYRAQRRQSCWWVVPASAAKAGFRSWHTCTEAEQLCVDAASHCPDSVHGVSRMSSCSIASFRPTPTPSLCMSSTRGPEWVHINYPKLWILCEIFLEKMNTCLRRGKMSG